MIYIDRKFLLFLSPRLNRFTEKKTDLYNFRCPFCGDSKKSQIKSRAYIYARDNDYFFRCHNCHRSNQFGTFLRAMDGELYKQYRLEKFIAKGSTTIRREEEAIKPEALIGDKPSEKFKKASDIHAESIAALPPAHYARMYIENRKIPKQFWNEIFYVEKYKDFLDTTFPNHGKEDIPNDARIVLLYTSPDQTITHVTGRALALDNKIRYVSVKIVDTKKVYGIHRLKKDQPVYITEGQFDSMFLPNAVACGDANLWGMADYLDSLGYNDLILVFDNQPRNKDIVREVKKAVDDGYNVVMLPYDERAKDINEMVLSGITLEEIKSLIDVNTFSGLNASVAFTMWRKC